MEKRKKSDELIIANKELAFQNREKEKRADELSIANKELAFQNEEKEKRAAELIIANKELAFQNKEKEKRAAELGIANIELAFQNEEKEKRAEELIIANKELAFQNKEKEKRAAELGIANIELAFQNDEKEKRAADLIISNKELAFQKKFLSVISHDLRNPLTALLISSDQLSRNTENHIFDGIQPLVKVIHRTSNKILQQLNELVDWAQMQRGKTTFNSEKLHLVHEVDQSLELLKANALQKNIALENKVPFDIYVNADALMLRSILQNLVTNSIKYTARRIDKCNRSTYR